MSTGLAITAWYSTVLAFGYAGYHLLRYCGLDHPYAWAAGRTAGLLVSGSIAWWLYAAGYPYWQLTVNVSLLIVAFALLLLNRKSPFPLKRLLITESIFLAGFLLILFIRLPHPEIESTEKFMDMGLLTMLSNSSTFPPTDLWLSGESIPYYYLGSFFWVLPLQLSNVPIEFGYNLIVATLGGIIAVLAWSAGVMLTNSMRGGLLAAFLSVAAGTLDGFRQLLINTPISDIDIWRSSRQVEGLITEFPLFSLWLGDLHPHLTSVPLLLTTLLIAIHIQQNSDKYNPSTVTLSFYALVAGATVASSPWNFPAVAAIMLLFFLASRPNIYREQSKTDFWPLKGAWVKLALVILLSWGFFAPFWLNYESPPFLQIKMSPFGTPLPDLLLYGGIIFLPLAGFSYRFFYRLFGDSQTGETYTLALFAATTVIAAVSGRPTLIFLILLIAPVAVEAFLSTDKRWRANSILSVTGLGLFLAPELFYLKDIYGSEFARMNTVFKFYFIGWFLLAIAFPANIEHWLKKPGWKNTVLIVLLLLSIPHTVYTLNRAIQQPGGLDGLRFMASGDRAAAKFLSEHASSGTVLEAVGDSYSNYARISAVSGIPAFLGWPGHEQVWRGNDIFPELERRRNVTKSIYSSSDPDRIRQLLTQEGINWLIIGSLENARYSASDLAVLSGVGETVFSQQGTRIIRWKSSEK